MKTFIPTLPAFLAMFALACCPQTATAAQPLPQLPPLPDPMEGKILGEPVDRLVWNKRPLFISLPVGKERLVMFPVPVRVGLPPELGSGLLRTQIVGGTLYLSALKEFPVQRVQVQAVNSGNIYLIDLEASKAAQSVSAVEVAVPEQTPAPGTVAVPNPTGTPALTAAPQSPPEPAKPKEQDYAVLIRTAAQQAYAPARLRRLPEGVHAGAVSGEAGTLLYRGGMLEATPVAALRSGALHVTAVRLRNLDVGEAELDPRRLRGNWQAAAFQHTRLAGKGELRDTTAVYLVSLQPYAEALHGR